MLCATDDDKLSVRTQLLADIREEFVAVRLDRYASEQLVNVLNRREDRPWPEFGRDGRGLTAKRLASLLKPFGIKPNRWRVDGSFIRGYSLSDFEETFGRYLQPIDPHPNDGAVDSNSHAVSLALPPPDVAHLAQPAEVHSEHETSTWHNGKVGATLEATVSPCVTTHVPHEPLQEEGMRGRGKYAVDFERVKARER